MLALFVLGLALLVGVMLLGRWYVSVEPRALVKALKWFSLIILVVVTLFMMLTGRLAWALFALPALFGWFMRFRSVARAAKNFSRMAGGGGGGGADDDTSEIETAFFKMVLNHASGDMDGEIISGTYRGKWLKDLGENDLLSLLQECRRGDEQSVLVLEAYLDRTHPDWRRRDGQASASGGDPSMNDAMDRNQALRVLDLQEGATDDQIKEAHHSLMSRLHPDHGGSTYLASKINQAKDVLLAK